MRGPCCARGVWYSSIDTIVFFVFFIPLFVMAGGTLNHTDDGSSIVRVKVHGIYPLAWGV